MRPTIARMLDCTIRLWRPVVTDDAIGVQQRAYTAQASVRAFINRPAMQEQDIGGGLGPSGGVRWYGLPTIDVRVRDVCEVTSGPEVGKLFEVNAPPVRPKNHHTQVDCIEWSGVLPVSPDAFLAGLAAPTKLIAAWKPDKIAKTFNDYKGTRHFVLVEPAPPRTIAWTDDLGGGDLAGFGVGLAENIHTDVEHAIAPWPTLDYFALHFLFRSSLPSGASTTLLGVQQNNGDPADEEVIQAVVWTTDAPTDPSNFPSAVGFSYVDADDAATATEHDIWFQDLAQGSLQPAPDVLTDICVSLGSDGRSRVWQNGLLVLDMASPGSSGKLWTPAGLVAFFIGNGILTGDGTRWFDNNYVLGPILLYNDTLTTTDVLANRAFLKTLGYTSLP